MRLRLLEDVGLTVYSVCNTIRTTRTRTRTALGRTLDMTHLYCNSCEGRFDGEDADSILATDECERCLSARVEGWLADFADGDDEAAEHIESMEIDILTFATELDDGQLEAVKEASRTFRVALIPSAPNVFDTLVAHYASKFAVLDNALKDATAQYKSLILLKDYPAAKAMLALHESILEERHELEKRRAADLGLAYR